MTNLLIRLFIKNSDDVTNEKVRTRYGMLSGAVGICTNLLLFTGKITAGLLSNSISIIADAINNLSDASSSVITLVGFKLSGKPADKEHPFGHARFEYLSGLAVAIIIMLIGVELGKTSINKIINPESVTFNLLSLCVLVGSMLLKLWQGLFYRKISKKISSTALIASATDSISDVITTGAVLTSALIAHFTGLKLDAYMGLAVAAFILYSGGKLVVETINPILGEAPDNELVEAIEDKIHSYQGVLGIHDLMVHSYGPAKIFASVHVEVSASEDIMLSHDLIDNIEREVGQELGIQLVVHLDPIVVDDPQVNELRAFVKDVVSDIDSQVTMHDFRAVQGPTHTNLIFDIVVPYGSKKDKDELVNEIAARIKQRDERLFAVITVDSSYVSINMPAK